MTGFGVGGANLGDGRICCEIRSLNHRFLDVRVRVPVELGEQAFFVEQLARERLSRGRYDVGFRLEGPALPPPRLSADRVRAAYRALAALRDELAPGTELPITAVLALPELTENYGSPDPGALRTALASAFAEALSALDAMRATEGAALERELSQRLTAVVALGAAIRHRAPELTLASHARLRARVERLMADAGVSVDRHRLEAELAVLADKTDVTEELVRLDSHAEQVANFVSGSDPVGRRLDFLLQEMAREVNTVGSKCQDSGVGQQVVELKSELERMREQVQNVE